MILRPYGVVIDGRLDVGLEVVVKDDGSYEIRPHTAIPEPYVLSPGFANAHSHLEYRGLQDRVTGDSYWPWIRELTRLKQEQTPEQVLEDARQAALENFHAGVRYVEDHSDRPVAGQALDEIGCKGTIYQELITFLEQESPEEKWEQVTAKAMVNSQSGLPVHISPHSAHLVDEASLLRFTSGTPISIHVAETVFEREFFQAGTGPIADLYKTNGFPLRTTGESVVGYLDRLGLVKPFAQFVHVCDVDDDDLERLALGGVRIAHCPRSNARLRCPIAPVRRFLDAGLRVGIGLDSPASSGSIDMFAEMRKALEQSHRLGEPLLPEEIWRMATLASPFRANDFIAIHIPDAHTTEDLILHGAKELVG